MAAGEKFRYLLNSVVTGDGEHDAIAVLTRHFGNLDPVYGIVRWRPSRTCRV